MAFNRHLAEEITKHRSDRNKALYFAGREAELGAAHNAFAEARNYSQTVFRVFTGAPGCGKSSLLTHIQEMNAAEPGLLFVDPDEENLHSRAALMDFVADEAIDHLASSTADRKQWAADIAAKYATPLAQSLGEAFRIKTAGEMLSEWQRKRGLDGLVVVIVYDETQNADEKVLSTLSQLHKQGIRGIPSVALLAGLSHGKQVLSKAGISRKAHNAELDMGTMSEGECAESTLAMLDDLRVEGSGAEIKTWAKRAAESSFGWPQHLCSAQKALCQMLLPVDGVLQDLDAHEFERLASEIRSEHYGGRIDDEEFGGDAELVQHIVVDLAGRSKDVRTDAELRGVCRAQIEALGRMDDPDFTLTPEGIADGLERKGVVCRDEDGRCVVPIPSMVTWAQEQLRGP